MPESIFLANKPRVLVFFIAFLLFIGDYFIRSGMLIANMAQRVANL